MSFFLFVRAFEEYQPMSWPVLLLSMYSGNRCTFSGWMGTLFRNFPSRLMPKYASSSCFPLTQWPAVRIQLEFLHRNFDVKIHQKYLERKSHWFTFDFTYQSTMSCHTELCDLKPHHNRYTDTIAHRMGTFVGYLRHHLGYVVELSSHG